MVRGNGIGWHLRVASLLKRERGNIDCYLSPTSFIVPWLVGHRISVVPVVHDLIALRREPHDRKAQWIERLTLPRAMRSAPVICALSESTATSVRSHFLPRAPIVVVHAGPTVEEHSTWAGTGDHLLCIATLCPRKNQLRLIQAYASLPSSIRGSVRLVLVGGRGWHDAPIIHAAEHTTGVTWMGFQSDATCMELLRTCRAVAWVSEEEGFGLPLLDALRVGAPVLTSDIPINHEIASDAALYANPHDVHSIAQGIEAVLQPSQERQHRGYGYARGFSWDATAQHVLRACHQAVDNRI